MQLKCKKTFYVNIFQRKKLHKIKLFRIIIPQNVEVVSMRKTIIYNCPGY